MRIGIAAAVAVVFGLLAPGLALASYHDSEVWFEGLTDLDRTVVQTNLVLTGNYNGLIDGSFGQGTYDALVGFQTDNDGAGDGVPTSNEIDALSRAAGKIYDELGFDKIEDTEAGLVIYLPKKLLTDQNAASGGNTYRSPDGAFELLTSRLPSSRQSFAELYKAVSTPTTSRTISYSRAGASRFAVSGMRSGRLFYTRFYGNDTESVGYTLAWSPKYKAVGSMLSIFLASFTYPLSEEPAPDSQAAQKRDIGNNDNDHNDNNGHDDEGQPGDIGMGSGFFFGRDGLIATNYHVAGTCSQLDVTGYGHAKLVRGNKDLDLAAIQLDSRQDVPVAPIGTMPPELAQSVILLGYPLADLLNSALNVSTGIVSSEDGSGDPNWFTTNAGIEPGNSGGPILDDRGNLLGLAVAKLDDAKLLQDSGTTAPNVGFAIKNTTLLKFLGGLDHHEAGPADGAAPSLQQAVKGARAYTVQIICTESDSQTAGVDDSPADDGSRNTSSGSDDSGPGSTAGGDGHDGMAASGHAHTSTHGNDK